MNEDQLKEKQEQLEKSYGSRLVALAECFGEALVEDDPDHLAFLLAAVQFIVGYAISQKQEQLKPLDYRNYLYN